MTSVVDALVNEKLPFARAMARSQALRIRRMDLFEDLEAAAMVGLFEAAQSYQPDRGPFVPHARHRIRGAMLDALRGMDRLSRRHRSMVNNEEASEIHTHSLSSAVHVSGGGKSVSFDAILPSPEPGPADAVQAKEEANAFLACLDAMSRQVVVAREIEGLTFAAIGQRMNRSPNRVYQIHRDAMERMSKHVPGRTGKSDLLVTAQSSGTPVEAWECAACAAEYWPKPDACPCCHGATFTRVMQRTLAAGRSYSPDTLAKIRISRRQNRAGVK